MHAGLTRYSPWVIIVAAFAILAVSYTSLPSEVVISRGFFGRPDTVAPRSLLTVFRVPVIDAICALAIAVIYRKFLNVAPELSNFWLVLLYTAACKCLLQTSEMILPRRLADVLFYLTATVVIAGILSAFFTARKNLAGFVKGLGRFSLGETLFLTVLLIAYLGVAIVPAYVYQ